MKKEINSKSIELKCNCYFNDNTYSIVQNIIERLKEYDNDDDNLFDNLVECADEEFVWINYQWAIIEEYSCPDDPMTFCDALDCFLQEVYDNLEYDYIEDEDDEDEDEEDEDEDEDEE